MKKLFIVLGIAATAVVLPVLAMSISPTRSLILGLVPDEAVLKLADEIDSSRIEATNKAAELQAELNKQKELAADQAERLAESEKTIAEQEKSIGQVKETTTVVQQQVVKQKDCSTDVALYCTSNAFKSAGAFDDFMKEIKDDMIDKSDEKMYDSLKKKFTEQYNKCQAALTCN